MNENLRKLIEGLNNNEALRAEFAGLSDDENYAEKFAALANEHGFEFKKEDLESAFSVVELPDEELSDVAGGMYSVYQKYKCRKCKFLNNDNTEYTIQEIIRHMIRNHPHDDMQELICT